MKPYGLRIYVHITYTLAGPSNFFAPLHFERFLEPVIKFNKWWDQDYGETSKVPKAQYLRRYLLSIANVDLALAQT